MECHYPLSYGQINREHEHHGATVKQEKWSETRKEMCLCFFDGWLKFGYFGGKGGLSI